MELSSMEVVISSMNFSGNHLLPKAMVVEFFQMLRVEQIWVIQLTNILDQSKISFSISIIMQLLFKDPDGDG